MAKTNQNDTFYANNKRTLRFTLSDVDVSPAVPLDVTGMLVRWALSPFLANGSYSTTPILKKDSAGVGGITITDAANGELDVDILPANTVSLSGKYYQELEVVDTDNNPVVVATGTITINKNVSNV